MSQNRKRNIKWLILPFTALLFFVATELASRFPQFTEKWYSQKIYPFLSKWISGLSSHTAFSLDDSFYLLLIAALLSSLVLLVFRKLSFFRWLKGFLNVAALVYILFYLLWGFNYYRPGLHQRIGIKEQNRDTKKFVAAIEKQIAATSRSVCSFEKLDKEKIDSEVEAAYEKLAPMLKINYPMGTRKAKNISFSHFFAKAGISGYYGPFFNEVHINSYNLPVEYPFVLAHEKAHQFGITSEAEANFIAWLVCTQSKSKQLKYSANLYILRFFLVDAVRLDQYPELMAKIDKKIKADFSQIQNYWKNLRDEKIDQAASKVNDTYLKTNKVEKGIEDYEGVVSYVIDFGADKEFRKKWNLNIE